MSEENLQAQITRYLKEVLSPALLPPQARLRFLAQGESTLHYRIQWRHPVAAKYKERNWPRYGYVLRLNKKNQPQNPNQSVDEYQALAMLQESGVTPRVYHLDDTRRHLPYSLLLMDYLPGERFVYERDLTRAAGVFGRIHALSVSPETFPLKEERLLEEKLLEAERLLETVWESPYVPGYVKDFLQRQSKLCQDRLCEQEYFIENPRRVLCNTQGNAENFIVGPEKAWLINWREPALSDPCENLAHFLAPTTTHSRLSQGHREEFLSAYIQTLTLHQREPICEGKDFLEALGDISRRIEIYTPYVLLQAVSRYAYGLDQFHKNTPGVANEAAGSRAYKLLGEDFLASLKVVQ